ncbi:helix-turn-helix domain-containing protein [Phytohabitans aurantiacus]|uniref:HTH cro/C1-type domain-containing protein n=1 Tax=Phytohabitans aurantiacus TaxID=3016789 RepID=A0ABQ5R409_9ACTN|nr:helix-turn-helix transcriptional regulator [Phytohabitans aurantiacus]GLI00948.1 hypothetical protein Pa4123_62240 [Phytohabitans aurantiacus]
MNGDSLSLRSRWLGHHMRELRDQRGLTIKYVAAYLGVDYSAVKRFEHGQHAFTREQVVALMDVYHEFDPHDRDRLLHLAQAVWQSHAQPDFDGAIPDEALADLLWLESEAIKIQHYSPVGIPELLHSAEYAERHAHATSDKDVLPDLIAARTRMSEQRSQLIRRQPNPVQLQVALHECALRHKTGGERVWSGQLEHLRQVATLPNVHMHVLPADAPQPLDLRSAFTLFTLPQPSPAQVVHIEYLGGRLFLEGRGAADHLRAFERLRYAALESSASASFITELANQLSTTSGR